LIGMVVKNHAKFSFVGVIFAGPLDFLLGLAWQQRACLFAPWNIIRTWIDICFELPLYDRSVCLFLF
jgi:hypothetical protein